MSPDAQTAAPRTFTPVALLGAVGAVLVASGAAWAGSTNGASVAGIPVFALCVAIAFVVQWIAFIPAAWLRNERFFDAIGALTYVTVAVVALLLSASVDVRSVLIAGLTVAWATRLGTFLAMRVHETRRDSRFRTIKNDLGLFFMTWTLQGLWVTLCFGAGLAAITASRDVPLDGWLIAGASLWLFGFVVEIVADGQKTKFRHDGANERRFITTGLWAWSRHPNYFGEIVLWIGIAVIAYPVLTGWQHVTLISPIFVWLLLTRISGVRMLENQGRRRWGDDPEYQAYVERTPKLLPRKPRA